MKIFVVGLGLMGASYAEKLTQKGNQVYGYDINPNYVKAAQEDGVILDNSNLSRLSSADVVILSLYPEQNVIFVKDHLHLFKKGAFITDISGVKQSLVQDIESVLREDLHYVSHHPMAGRAKEGYQHRDPDMFLNNHFLIIESERASLTDYELIEIIGKQLGFKTLTRISASLHDQMIAYTSQLTHMIAVSLMLGYPSESHKFTGDSFRDLTRIANINEKLWTELFLSNQKDLLDAMDIFKKHLNALEKTVKNNDQETLMELLRLSRKKERILKMILRDLNYDIHITNNNHQLLIEKLHEYGRVFIVTDAHVYALHQDFFNDVFDMKKTVIHVIKPGETSKSLEVYQTICDNFLDHHIKRDDVIVAVGGGVVGDLTGFVAASLLRGVDFIQVPTTLLAMVDSSVGSKVGINTRQGKNLIGHFYDPTLVHIDTTFLNTLTKRERYNGYAEIIKASLIGDPKLFDQLKNPKHSIEEVIMLALQVKIDIVKKDPFESHERMFLNFGHTLGHAIEKEMNYETIKHGEAISHGMMYAIKKGIEYQITEDTLEREVENLLHQYELLNTQIGEIEMYEKRMQSDKKQRKDGLQFVLIQSIGNPIIKII